MRWFRIRLVILGLLLFVVHVGSSTETCDSRFSDPGSSAFLADVVIEGRVKSRPPGNEDRYNSSIQVRKILKGEALVNGGKRTRKITVGFFGPLNKTECVSEAKYNKKYIFFLRVSDGNGKYFQVSALPVERKKKTIRSIKKIVCKNCAKAPVIKKIKNQRKRVGQKVKLRCSAKGKPNPVFIWYKDGERLSPRKGLRIKSGRRGSRVEIKKATKGDGGVYMCEASNAVGDSNASADLEIVVDKPQYPECKYQTYCLNGGTCRFIRQLNQEFCECPEAYVGRRCELRSIFYLEPEYNKEAKLLHDRTLIIIGIVIAILIFIAICMISYYLAKRQRKKFEARISSRNIPRQTRGNYQTLDEVDGGRHRRLISRVCRERGMQTDNIPELSPRTHVDSTNGGVGQRVFSMEHSFPAMSEPPSEQQQQQQQQPRMNRSSRGSRTRLKAVSLDETGVDEPDCIPMTEMPRSLRSEGSIHDVIRRDKRNMFARMKPSLSNPPAEDVCNLESTDPVVASVEAVDSVDNYLEEPCYGEQHLFTDDTTPEPDDYISDPEEVPDVEEALLGNEGRGDSLDLDTDTDDEVEQNDFIPLHISEENLERSWGSSLDTGYERSRDPDDPTPESDLVSDLPVKSGYERSRDPDDPTPESDLVSDLPVKPDSGRNIFNHHDAERTTDVLPNGPQQPDAGGSNFSDSPESFDRSSSQTGSQDSMDNTTSGASSQVPNCPDEKLAWDENGTPVSPNYAFTAAMNSDDPLLVEEAYMHQELPVSPSKQNDVCNKLFKDLHEDQGPIQI